MQLAVWELAFQPASEYTEVYPLKDAKWYSELWELREPELKTEQMDRCRFSFCKSCAGKNRIFELSSPHFPSLPLWVGDFVY